MNIINKLTLRHLKENKGRTFVTIVGVFVSVIMITALIVGVSSFLSFYRQLNIQNEGYFHAGFQQITQKQAEQLEKDDRISRVGRVVHFDNTTDSFQISNAKTKRLGTGTFFTGDEIAIKQIITGHFEGSIPKNDNEIIVDKKLIDENGFDWKIGDVVSISIGARFREHQPEFAEFMFGLHYEYETGEVFEVSEVKDLKIVGIIENNNPTMAYGSIIRGISEKQKRISGATIELKSVNPNSLNEIKDIAESIGITGKAYSTQVYTNRDYLATYFAISPESTMAKMVPLMIMILVIIMIASIVLIYNAFGMSLSERTRYLGMLASIGSTRKQKKASVYFEGLILGLIGIPLGIGAGILGVFIFFNCFGDKIISTNLFLGVGDLKLKTVVPFWGIICVIIISFITIIISSIIPAKRASAITPIEAIRQSNDVKMKAKRLKSSKLIRKIFGYEGELANKNLKRNSIKTHIITGSIALSVILFLSVNYFCSVFLQVNELYVDLPYQVEVYIPTDNYDTYDNLKKELMEVPGVDKVYSTQLAFFSYSESAANPKVGSDFIGDNQDLRRPEYLTHKYKNLWRNIRICINYIEDEDFNALCKANGIDYTKYYDSHATFYSNKKCLVMNNISHKESGSKVFTNAILGKGMYSDYRYPITDEDDNIIGWEGSPDDADQMKKIIISDFVDYDEDNYVCHFNPKNEVSAYMPMSMEDTNFLPDGEDSCVSLGIETKNHKDVAARLGELFDDNSYNGAQVIDRQMYLESGLIELFILQLFIYVFIGLIILITLANIINTISTGIELRRKEFAMLKSIGITQKGFLKMICLESLFYALKSLAFAIPASVLISYILSIKLDNGVVAFEINYLIYIAVIVVVFLIVGFAMLFSVYKLKDDSIIETLKKDIN